jgi:fibronectin-binding autotransporter adhesin
LVINAASASITGGAGTNAAAVGVDLGAAGSVTNAISASIKGGHFGVYVGSGAGTVANAGTIVGTSTVGIGVDLGSGGSVSNATSASISGAHFGVYINGSAGTVINSGSITATGTAGTGVYLHAGGSATNATAASITGVEYGVRVNSGTGTVVNSGSIAATATNGVGVYLHSGGSVTNAASAFITGGNFGVALYGGGSVTNAIAASIKGSIGILVFGGSGTVANSGAIVGSSGAGVFLLSGGSVINAAVPSETALIAGAAYGVRIALSAGTVVNSGFILGTATQSMGVVLSGGGSVTNAAHATIQAEQYGVDLVDGGTVVNSGFIEGIFRGVNMTSGSITNAAFGVITGYKGIEGTGGTETVINSGTISGTRFDGIVLPIGASVTNAGSGLITGSNGIEIFGAGTVVNSGTITASSTGGGVYVRGGSVTNAASALITGYFVGVDVSDAGTVVNSGVITGVRYGIKVNNGGTVVNSGTAKGGRYGIILPEGGTLTNAGTITGSSGTAVYIGYAYAGSLLVVDPGAVFNGRVAAVSGTSNALELASGTGTGTLNGLGTNFTRFRSATVDGGASWELTGTNTVAAGATLANSGTMTLSGGTLSDLGSLVNSGGIVIEPGTLSVANLTGNGSVTISSGGMLNVLSGSANKVTVSSGGTIVVSTGATASGTTVAGGGTVEVFNGGTLAGNVANDGTVVYDIIGSTTFSGTLTGGGTLVVSGGGHLDVLSAYTGAAQVDDASTLEFTSTYVGVATFSGASIGSGGTLKLDVPSSGPITVVNPNDAVIAQPGGGNWIDAAVSYTLPANIDSLFLFAGAQGAGNSDASGDALYALDAVNTQTLTGNSANDTFVVYNSSDIVVPKAASHDTVYAAVSYTLPTGVDTLILEAGTQGTGNSDAAGDALWAANPGQVATLTGKSANDVFVVYNSSDLVVPKAASHDTVYAAASYKLPSGVDVLYLEAGTQGTGNSDAAGDALYAANGGIAQTLTGNSANDVFVVYNSSDVVVPKASSHDVVYAGTSYTLPTGVDVLYLEAGTQGAGNSDVAGDALYAANAGIAQTLTGHSHNDTFVLYNAGDAVVGQAGSTDTVYAAANFTLPTNVDTLFLEGNASHGTGNGDANNLLVGNGGVASTLVAGSGTDLLVVAGTAGTIMTGGAGHDTFAFPNVMGHDEVTNFGTPKDTLQFNATLFSNFTAAMTHASQVGANTVFTIDTNDTVTLDNVAKTSLTAGNFHFS